MSHFTKVKTVIRDREFLCEALRQLHHEFREGENLVVRGYRGGTERADVVVDTGCQYDVGFQRQADQTYAAVADWSYGVHGNATARYRTDTWLAEVHQKCAHLSVRAKVIEMGHLIEEERVLPSGEIEIIICEPI